MQTVKLPVEMTSHTQTHMHMHMHKHNHMQTLHIHRAYSCIALYMTTEHELPVQPGKLEIAGSKAISKSS